MNRLSYSELLSCLRSTGIKSGDVVHVQSDLLRVGPVDTTPNKISILEFYLEGFREVLGPTGTLTCCTAFEDYARYGHPYVLEKSPSLTDSFSEFIRKQPDAVRSIHPIVSVTAIGDRAEEICGGNHYEGFGYDSPWGRLHRSDALLVSLGLDETQGGTTFFHYVESVFGVPYKYNKIYRTPVYARDKKVEKTFTLSVRYLDFGIENTPVRIKSSLLKSGFAKITRIGKSKTWSCRAKDAFELCIGELNEDRYFLLKNPPNFREGVIPDDGLTGDMVEYVDKGDVGE